MNNNENYNINNTRGKPDDTLLGGCRVLDLTDEKGSFCGKLLADSGADVIKIEAPDKVQVNEKDTSSPGIPKHPNGFSPLMTNTSKRSIILDINNREGRKSFIGLVKSADIVVESFPPGYLNDLGLAYSDLQKINPKLVLVIKNMMLNFKTFIAYFSNPGLNNGTPRVI